MPKKKKKMYGGGMMPPANAPLGVNPAQQAMVQQPIVKKPPMNVGMMGGGYVKRYAHGGGVRKVRYE